MALYESGVKLTGGRSTTLETGGLAAADGLIQWDLSGLLFICKREVLYRPYAKMAEINLPYLILEFNNQKNISL